MVCFFSQFCDIKMMPVLSKKWAKLNKFTLKIIISQNFPSWFAPIQHYIFAKKNHYHLMYVVGQLEANFWPWQDNDWG